MKLILPETEAKQEGMCGDHIALYTSWEWPKYVAKEAHLVGSHCRKKE